jgi:hypothetical protein
MVIGIKVYDADRVAVVVWARIGGEIEANMALDIGFNNLSNAAKSYFEDEMHDGLPAVGEGSWIRHDASPAAGETPTLDVSYSSWYPNRLQRPFVPIPFATVTHTMGWIGDALNDFNLDCGKVFYEVFLSTPIQ